MARRRLLRHAAQDGAMGDHDRNSPEPTQAPDAGAFIGQEPELGADSIPGGAQRGDERVAGVATRSTGPGAAGDVPEDERGWPEGHREGPPADDDAVRRAGENR
jgi:hypothetical protein